MGKDLVMTPEEIKELATDTFKEKVFFSTMLQEGQEHLLTSVFMPVMFMDNKQIKDVEEKNIVAFYEYFEKATPRSINGYPMFMSMHMINKEDLTEVQELIKKLQDATNAV